MRNRMKGLWKQWRALFDKGALERELDEEMAFHIDKETEANMAAGMDPAEARRRAELEFRGRERYKEEVRDARWTRVLEDALNDMRYVLRGYRKRPAFAAAAVLTLALGIGGTTAVFTVVRAVLYEPLPYAGAESLVRLYTYHEDDPSGNQYVSAVHFRAYRERAESFSDLATAYTYDETGADLRVGDRPERVRTLQVSPGYFDLLGARMIEGRTFTADEERGQAVTVLSRRLARRLAPDVGVGETVELDGAPHTVVGIASSLEDPIVGPVDLWLPEHLHDESANISGNHYLSVLGRLAPGVTAERARAEMASLDQRLADEYPDVADDSHFRLVMLHDDVVQAARPTLLLLLGAVGVVLLIAVVNVANLQMVRSLGRSREVAVRTAIGASRGRVARQVLAESVLLAGFGGAAGVALAFAGVEALVALGGSAVPRAAEVTVDGMTLAFAAGVTILTGVGFGTVPALRLAGLQPARSLRDGRGGGSSGRFVRARSALVAGQVALALILLAGASVLAISVHRLGQVDLGLRTDDVLTFQLNLPAGRYDEAERAGFHHDLAARLAALPQVRSAGAIHWIPASGSGYRWGTRPLTGPGAGGGRDSFIGANQRVVAGAYFDALGVPLLDGRVFDGRDGPDSDPVVVIDRAASERLFPGISAVGQRLSAGGRDREVIGVVENVATDIEGTTAPHVYHLHAQFANRLWAMSYLVHTTVDPLTVLPAVRDAVAERDPALVVHQPAPLGDRLGQGRSRRAFAFVLTTTFAGLALTLALIGLYGVLAYVVGQRTREFGIRIALGAQGHQVAGRVLRQGFAVVGIGLAIGTTGAIGLGRLLESLVFNTEPTDPWILAGAAAALFLAATTATLLPAARAARTPPRTALSQE